MYVKVQNNFKMAEAINPLMYLCYTPARREVSTMEVQESWKTNSEQEEQFQQRAWQH